MEFKITTFQRPAEITFNYEELERELAAKTQEYASIVYSEDQMKEAKADRALLRKLKDAIDSERKRVKTEYMEPFTDFENKTKRLMALIDEPINAIDGQVKAQEEKKKAEKKSAIESFFNGLENRPEWLDFDRIFDEKWLNVTVSMPVIHDTITTRIRLIRQDLNTLSTMPFAFEATEAYKTSLDLNSAIAEGQRLEAIQKAKEEAQRKAEEEKAAAEQPKEEPKVEEPVSVPQAQVEEKKGTYALAFQIEPSKLPMVKQFFRENGIATLELTYEGNRTFKYVQKG